MAGHTGQMALNHFYEKGYATILWHTCWFDGYEINTADSQLVFRLDVFWQGFHEAERRKTCGMHICRGKGCFQAVVYQFDCGLAFLGASQRRLRIDRPN